MEHVVAKREPHDARDVRGSTGPKVVRVFTTLNAPTATRTNMGQSIAVTPLQSNLIRKLDKGTRSSGLIMKNNSEKVMRQQQNRKQTFKTHQKQSYVKNDQISDHNDVVTRQEVIEITTKAFTAAANFILEKLHLNDVETFRNLQQEIIKNIADVNLNCNTQDPLKSNEGEGETARNQDQEP